MIGVFDSGFGGLAILKEVAKTLPEYDYLYLGDSARTPYGNRSKETVTKFTEEAVDYLFEKGCRLVLVACHTASSDALCYLQKNHLRKPKVKNRKILGVTIPLAEKAVQVTRHGRIGVTGTRGTIKSRSFEIELKKLKPKIVVTSQACPLLVPLIEENYHNKPEAKMILKKYLRPLKSANVDTLILGCTHYPLMWRGFQRVMGKNCKVLHSGKVVAESLQNYLTRHPEIEKLLSKKEQRKFLTTDNAERFEEVGREFWEGGLKAKKVELS